MPIEPMEDHPRSPSPQPGTPAPTGAAAAPERPPHLERSRFGGTERRPGRPDDGDAPFSRSDLRKGAQELVGAGRARIRWSVLGVSSG